MYNKIDFKKIDSFSGNTTNNILLVHRPCPVCGCADTVPIYSYAGWHFFSDSATNAKRIDINTVQCKHCLGVYMNPAYSPWGFNTLFSEAGMSYGSPGGHRNEICRWLIKHLSPQKYTKILDIGCYDGSFLATLPKDFKKYGVDIDEPAIKRGLEAHPDFILINAPLEQFELPEHVDIITMFHLLEHLSNPLDILKKLYAVAGNNTKLIIEVPVIDFMQSYDVVGLYTPQHLTHFSKNTLTLLLKQAGWNILSSHKMDNYLGYRIIAVKGETDRSITPNLLDKKYALSIAHQMIQANMDVEEKINTILHDIKNENIVLWGAGMHTEALYQKTTLFLEARNLKYCIVDTDILKHGKTWRGINIYPPSDVKNIDWDKTKIIISSYGSMRAIVAAAKNFGVPENNICCLYQTVNTY